MKRKRIPKPRVRVEKNTRTEAMLDVRLKRVRTRADQLRAALEEAHQELDELLEENR